MEIMGLKKTLRDSGIARHPFLLGIQCTQDDDADLGISEADYTFTGVTIEHNGISGTFGSWGDDFSGEYFEVAYGTEVGGFDVGVGVIFSGSDLDDDEAMYFSLSKSFEL